MFERLAEQQQADREMVEDEKRQAAICKIGLRNAGRRIDEDPDDRLQAGQLASAESV